MPASSDEPTAYRLVYRRIDVEVYAKSTGRGLQAT
jgi:hypothetical protein